MNFKLDAKAFFLTYPKCDLSRDDVLDALRKKLVSNTIDNYCIAIEQHEDGTPHLHCLIVLDKKKSVRSANYFDIEPFHGNYQSARNRVKIFDYITKADPTPLTNMCAESLKIKTATRELIGKRILAGEEPKDLIAEYPSILFGYKRLQDDIKAFKEDQVQYQPLPMFLPNQWGFLLNTGSSAKKRHWWIWSAGPNKGKTTWAKDMETRYGAHIKSCDFTYWNITGREPLLILDDYNIAGLRFNAVNQLCDGVFEARVFMGGVRRIRPQLVIILSNASIRDLYPIKYELIEARFIQKEI